MTSSSDSGDLTGPGGSLPELLSELRSHPGNKFGREQLTRTFGAALVQLALDEGFVELDSSSVRWTAKGRALHEKEQSSY